MIIPIWQHIVFPLSAALLGLIIAQLVAAVVHHAFVRSGKIAEKSALARLKGPFRTILFFVGLSIGQASVPFKATAGSVVFHLLLIALVGSFGWFIFRCTYVFEDVMRARLRIDQDDNLHARRIQTQIQVFRRIVGAVVVILAVSVILLSFSPVRVAGESLLASAGVLGVIIGLAAKPITSNFLAGIQIAISQPIRVDDVVVVDGHWGRVEDINLTYVVIRIWDLRALILPISYLISNPFENWTRTSAKLLEYVHLDVDHSAPIQLMRDHLLAVLKSSPEWDGETWNLQVTQAGPSCIQVRALMSARDSSSGWILQCKVREELISFLWNNYPEALPRVRTGVNDKMNADSEGEGERPNASESENTSGSAMQSKPSVSMVEQ